ncbi:MAG TPA: LanC-like protein [Candidatus Baltobacteraceae bacterium]|nr:LanC-like protein [Candidatus Baltobacteraceae bacterium]
MSSGTIYEADEHEALTDTAFDRDEARSFVVETVRAVDGMYEPENGWPLHPEDDYGRGKGAVNLGVYFGAAGSIWALARLAERYDISLRHDYRRAIARAEERYDSYPADERVPSYWMGAAGIAFVRYLLTNEPDALARCIAAAESNLDNPTREFMWGSPGTVFPALLLRERGDGPQFDALLRSVHDELWETWEPESDEGGLLWLQELYEQRRRFVGPAHGAITNVAVFVRAFDLLDTDRRSVFAARLRAMLERYALSHGDATNWYSLGQPLEGNRMQWCHGAAGIITSLAALDRSDDVIEDLLLRGGNGVWLAGALKKGPTLCHGTAGNGFALLQLGHRTGDELWLQRAQRFATHAIAQTHAWRSEFGLPSASLWTGDLGVAVYVDAVLRNDPRVLSHDVT